MPPLRKAILAGAAAIALVGVAGWAAAEIKNAHTLDVRLPNGLAHIRYVGDTPPTVSFAPAPSALSILSPASDPFGAGSPFAALEQITQAMDRQSEAMLRDASAQPQLAFTGPDLMQVDIAKLPPGAQGFSMVSTVSGNGVCTRSVEYRSLGDGKPPQVVTRTSGACTPDEKRAAPSVTSSTAVASTSVRAGRRPI
jgi:hypothetical protein